MRFLKDIYDRRIRFTDERWEHIMTDHPEMSNQIGKIKETLLLPDRVVRSLTDDEVELFYRDYHTTPVTRKYLCIVVKVLIDDLFIITAYFTDTIKKGDLLWQKK